MRRQNVLFTRASVNSYFKLPNIDNDELAAFEKAPDYDDVLMVLYALGTEWIWHNDEWKCLKIKTIYTSNKAWTYFLNPCLMPVSHHSDFTPDRVVLLYAIIKDYLSIWESYLMLHPLCHSQGEKWNGIFLFSY
ncbi:hypothetical protein PanWU01x14_224570 [Parasponia andersonii]|uniref:Putative plant transposon protein domain-containing protein n=1 Tax=Parasponia andersonii TaxID=3476 RepID=A0A2P5BN91_PARAD|nr:hypothetical protein PanWU01x14_224570 [Parasponia andersonii]